MRTAIFSDVHGNLTALEAVLADIKQQSPDLIVFAGDLCLFGPRPAECIDLIQAKDISAIYGNQDEPLCNQPPLSDGITREEWEEDQNAADIVSWTRLQLTAHQRAWLHMKPKILLLCSSKLSPVCSIRHYFFCTFANNILTLPKNQALSPNWRS